MHRVKACVKLTFGGQIYQAVIAVGLDINPSAFKKNVELLKEACVHVYVVSYWRSFCRGGYYGRVNLRSGEQEEYKLNHLISFKQGYLTDIASCTSCSPVPLPSSFLDQYFALASQVLVLEESQLMHAPKPGDVVHRLPSHTATVTYHALRGEYGKQRTFVPWEPVNETGERGVQVMPEHCWMYVDDGFHYYSYYWCLLQIGTSLMLPRLKRSSCNAMDDKARNREGLLLNETNLCSYCSRVCWQ